MYVYKDFKQSIFTETEQKTFLHIRDNVKKLLELSGAARMQEIIRGEGDWFAMACVDKLVELEELLEITEDNVVGQYRVFVKFY